jgi:hypothetical protein
MKRSESIIKIHEGIAVKSAAIPRYGGRQAKQGSSALSATVVLFGS